LKERLFEAQTEKHTRKKSTRGLIKASNVSDL